jgi:Apea-like HEPN
VCGLQELFDVVSRREVYAEVLAAYKGLVEKLLQPTGQEFIESVADALVATVKNYEFLIRIEGLDLGDQDVLELGSYRIQRESRALLESIKFEGALDLDSIYAQFKEGLWLVGSSRGGNDVAVDQFEHRVSITVGLLAICGALRYKGAIWRSRVRAVISPLENRSTVLILRWERGGENPSLTRRWGSEQDLTLDSTSVAYLTNACFLKQLASLPDREDRTDLQDAIIRSVYWFADAYRDPNKTMKFIKLWSCAECFFAIDKEEVTELNAKGLAAVLTFAGFNISDVKEYAGFKNRIKRLYGLRSEAIHQASFGHIQTTDLNDLSVWIAWLIISMVFLSERGYRTLRQIQEQVSRLDQLSENKNDRTGSAEQQ